MAPKGVAFSPDGCAPSASADGIIRIGKLLRPDDAPESLTFTSTPDGPAASRWPGEAQGEECTVASTGHDGIVMIWDAQTGRVSATFSGHDEFSGIRALVFCVAWRPKSHHIASAGLDTVRVWDATTEREVFKLPSGPGKVALPYQAVTFSPDGRYLVTGKVNGAVQIWDGETGQEVGTLGTHKREIRGVVFSKGGENLASASSDGDVKIWDATRLDKKSLKEM